MDTRDKRASVLGLALVSLLVLPEPGTIDQADRQQVAFSYRGILAGALDIVSAVGDTIVIAAEDRTIGIDAEDRTIRVLAEDRTFAVTRP